jgi:hypothetical protein
MTLSDGDRARPRADAGRAAKRDRRPLRYRIGTVVRISGHRIDLACLDGRVIPVRLAERTLFTLGGQRLSGAGVLRPGLEVRVASVDSSRGTIAVLVELIARTRGHARQGGPSILPVNPERLQV